MTGYHCQFSRFLLKEFLVENKIRHCSLMSLIRGGNKICGREENKKKRRNFKINFLPNQSNVTASGEKGELLRAFGSYLLPIKRQFAFLGIYRWGYQKCNVGDSNREESATEKTEARGG